MPNKGRAIFLVYTDLADDKYDQEFNDWYNTRHLPQLTQFQAFWMPHVMSPSGVAQSIWPPTSWNAPK